MSESLTVSIPDVVKTPCRTRCPENLKIAENHGRYATTAVITGMCLALVRQRLIPSTGGVPAGRGGSDIGNRLHQPIPSPLPGGDAIPG